MWQSRASKDEAGAIPMAASESAESETRMTSGWDKMGLGKSVVGIGAHESTYFGVKKKITSYQFIRPFILLMAEILHHLGCMTPYK